MISKKYNPLLLFTMFVLIALLTVFITANKTVSAQYNPFLSNNPYLMDMSKWKANIPAGAYDSSKITKSGRTIRITSSPLQRGAFASQTVRLQPNKTYRISYGYTAGNQSHPMVYLYNSGTTEQIGNLNGYDNRFGGTFEITGKARNIDIGLYKWIEGTYTEYRNVTLSETVYMPDPNLRRVINDALGYGKVTRQIGKADLWNLRYLRCDFFDIQNAGIKDLTGLEHAVNLEFLCMADNEITDLTPIKNLTKIKKIYMGRNKITSLEPIRNLTNLDVLSIYENEIVDISPISNLRKMISIKADRNDIRDLTPIRNLTNLDDLRLHVNYKLSTGFEQLPRLNKLTYLDLGYTGFRQKDMDYIKDLTNLEVLSIAGNQINNISKVSKLKELYHINLMQNNLSDLKTLDSLSKLTTVIANDQAISLPTRNLNEPTNIVFYPSVNFTSNDGTINYSNNRLTWTALKNLNNSEKRANFSSSSVNFNGAVAQTVGDTYIYMPDPNLRRLVNEVLGKGSVTSQIYKSEMEKIISINNAAHNTYNRNISDLRGLEHAKNLVTLNLNQNNIFDLSPLKDLKKLENLYLLDNNVYSSQINYIKDLPLKRLTLQGNNLTNISRISEITTLNYLLLGRNRIVDMSPVSTLRNLETLHLHENQISEIKGLDNLRNLNELSLNQNNISDITPLKNIVSQFHILDLHTNQIEDISVLKDLKRDTMQFGEIWLSFNKIKDMRPINHIEFTSMTRYLLHNQTIQLPNAEIGVPVNECIAGVTRTLHVTSNDGDVSVDDCSIIWNSVRNDTSGLKTFRVRDGLTDGRNHGFSATIEQYVEAGPIGTIDFEMLMPRGNSYFNSYYSFFEGEEIKFLYRIRYRANPGYENSTSGPMRIVVSHGPSMYEINLDSISLKDGEVTEALYSDQYIDKSKEGIPFFHTKPFQAPEISGNDFKVETKTYNVNLYSDDQRIETGNNATRQLKYNIVNKVYDVSVNQIVSKSPDPIIPGENADIQLQLCNLGNQSIPSLKTKIEYNGVDSGEINVKNLSRGTYKGVEATNFTPNCVTRTVPSEVVDPNDPNALIDLKASVLPTLPSGASERTTSNNSITETVMQGVGEEPIAICDNNGDFIKNVYSQGEIPGSGGHPDNCIDDVGMEEIPDIGEPIIDGGDYVEIVDEPYEFEEASGPTNAPVAKTVNGNNFKEETEKIFVEANPDKKHPSDDINKSNDYKEKSFKSVNRVHNIKVKDFLGLEPAIPKSNESVDAKFKVCNTGNQNIVEFLSRVSYKNADRNSGEKKFTNLLRGPYNNINSIENCVDIEIPTTMFDIEREDNNFMSRVLLQPKLPSGFSELTTSDNILTFDTTVQNPNVSIHMRNLGDDPSVISETGEVRLIIDNRYFDNISSPCNGNCNSGHNQITTVNITNELTGEVVASYTYNFNNLGHGEKRIINISDDIINYIRSNNDLKYEVIPFRVQASIPHYKDEVDYSGQSRYSDNKVDETIYYFPPRPNISVMDCNIIEAQNNYFGITDGGLGAIKSCAGHYPNNPSTSIEEGMQAYHFVMYRFFPAPIPKYDIKTVSSGNSTDPNTFNQIFEFNETITNKGDEEHLIFTTNTGGKEERGRYIPTGAAFDFEVKEKKEDGKVIAKGRIHYELGDGTEGSCVQEQKLDLKQQYGCNEIMLFVPNADNDSKYEAPPDYNTNSGVSYPLGGNNNTTTKIPYLNPGLYEFTFEATENYDYFYQTNEAVNTDYYWSNVKKK